MSLGNKPDSLDLLTERDMDRYKHQRRVIGRVYGIANIRRHERLIDGALEAAVSRIRALDGAEVDLREWMHIIVVECLSAVVLSRPAGLLRAGSDGGTGDHAYAAWRMKSVVGLFPWIAARRYTHRRLVRLFCRLMKVTYSTPPSYKTFFTVSYLANSDPPVRT